MTSAHSMFVNAKPHASRMRFRNIMLLLMWVSLCGCATRERLCPPQTLASPYERTQLWAIVPFTNESGTSIVRTDRIADAFTEQAEEVQGIAMVPVNRVLAAMQQLKMPAVLTPAHAMRLMNVLHVDGLIVGTVTTYDPYPPLKLGAAVQLYRREFTEAAASLDAVALTRARTEHVAPGAISSQEPAAQASGVFDASNHQTLLWLDAYAVGRAEPNSAYGKKVYLVSMEMYTQFVAYRLLHDLLAIERARLQPETTQPPNG